MVNNHQFFVISKSKKVSFCKFYIFSIFFFFDSEKMQIKVNKNFPTFSVSCAAAQKQKGEISIVHFDETRGYCLITPFMNIKHQNGFDDDFYDFKPSICPWDDIQTDDLSLLHHGETLLFENKEIQIKYTLKATVNTKEKNITIVKYIQAPNDQYFTLQSFIAIVFEHMVRDFHYHLPKSAQLQGSCHNNDLDYFSFHCKENIVHVHML